MILPSTSPEEERRWKNYRHLKEQSKKFAEALKKIDLTLPEGTSNKIFPDISEHDRACGRVRLSDLH